MHTAVEFDHSKRRLLAGTATGEVHPESSHLVAHTVLGPFR